MRGRYQSPLPLEGGAGGGFFAATISLMVSWRADARTHPLIPSLVREGN